MCREGPPAAAPWAKQGAGSTWSPRNNRLRNDEAPKSRLRQYAFRPAFARGTMMRSSQIIGDAGSGTHPFWAAT